MSNAWFWMWIYDWSPKSILVPGDSGNTSTYTETQYVNQPPGEWNGPNTSQYRNIQGPEYGANNSNYGSDYFQDAWGYKSGYAPTVAPSEPPTFGAGQWVNGKYVAQPISNTDLPTREQR